MASQFGFCNTCGAPRSTGAAQFCDSCGSSLPALGGIVPAAAVPPPPPPSGTWATPPPQANWTAPAQQPGWGAAPPPPPAWGGTPAGAQARKRVSPIALVLALVLIAAVAVGAFALMNSKGNVAGGSGGPTATATLHGTAKPGATSGPAATGQGGGSGLGDTSAAFANITSFKFSMTLAGGSYGSMLSALGASGTGDVPFTMSGTIVVKPEKAADINMGGFHMIEVGGFDYLDMGGTGAFFKTAATSGSSLADSFSPETMFSSAVGSSSSGDYQKVGTESKNGVQADHYRATSSAMSAFGSAMGVTAATWTGDIWVSVTGGYPVSMSFIGSAADNSVAFELAFDISNVNDPSNKVTAPTNVSGI